MNEVEIVGQLAVHGDRTWSILQYWTSVSFGILVAGHFAANRIHWAVLGVFGLLYFVFSYVCYEMFMFDSKVITAGLAQLQNMVDNDEAIGPIGLSFIENSPLNNLTLVKRLMWNFMGLGLFLTTLGYPAYCHLKSRNLPNE